MRQIGGAPPEQPPVRTDVEMLSEPERESHLELPSQAERHSVQELRPEPELQVEPHLSPEFESQPMSKLQPDLESQPEPQLQPKSQVPLEAREGEQFPVPHPVQVHRIDRQPVDSSPPVMPAAAEPVSARSESPELRITEAEPNLTSGRWEEFGEPRLPALGRDGRLSRELPPLPHGSPWGLLAEERPKRRSSFLRIVLPLAILAAIGAALWSGYLRERLGEQDARMSALQEQNRKLAESLVKVTSDREAANPETASPADQNPSSTGAPASTPSPATTPSSEPDQSRVANANGRAAASAPAQSAPAAAKREGVSAPPASSGRQRGSQRPADANYHPEIVPPYPTLPARQNTALGGTAARQAAPQQAHAAPPPANASAGLGRSGSAAASSAHPPQLQGTSQPANTASSPASTPAYSATSSGMYATALAQNIETVEGLQRNSVAPLREFHAPDGVPTRVTPNLSVVVRSPDQAGGTFALAVNGGGTSYQLRGHVKSPLAFVDSATHQRYELVILHIDGAEAYGYIRSVR